MTENAKQLVQAIFAIHRMTPPYSSESIPLTDNGVKVGILVRKDEGFPLVGNTNGLIRDKNGDVIVPLYEQGVPMKVQTFYSLLRNSSGQYGIRKFILSGTVYWANTGLILDEDLNPLFLCTIDLPERKKPKCYVSPKVFESSSPLSKGIVFTVLNVMYNYGIITLHGKIQKPEVIIGPIDNIVKPTVPSSVDTFNDDVNDFLADNVDVVMRQWE
jgi:hypothetical protein